MLLSLFLFVFTPSVFAQDEEDGPEAPPPSTPIDKTTPLLVVAGVVVAYRILQKKLSNEIG